jgi:hypothetical protein
MERTAVVPSPGRISLGFVLTPPAAGLATLVYGWMFGVIADETGRHIPGAVPLPVAVGLGVYAFAIAVPVTGFVAVPLFDYLRKRRPLSLGMALSIGACCAVGAYLAIALWILVAQSAQTSWRSQLDGALNFYAGYRAAGFLFLIAAIGATAAAPFWMIAIRGTRLDATLSLEP